MIISTFIIALLVTTNIMFVWYIRKLLNIINDTTEGINDMKEAINAFSQHLQQIYKQETYYGDPTIERLIKHSKVLVDEIDQFVKVFLVSQPIQTEINDNEKTTNK